MRLPLVLLALVEGLIFALSFIAGYHLRLWSLGSELPGATTELTFYAVIVALVFVFAMGALGLYETSIREGLTGFLLRIGLSLFVGSAGLAALSFAFPQLGLWRSILALTALVSFSLITALRVGFYYLQPDMFRRRVLVFGDSGSAAQLAEAAGNVLRIVGVVPSKSSGNANPSADPVMIKHDRPLVDIVAETQADEIVLAVKDRRGELPMEELLDCRMTGIQILQPQSFFERELGVVRLDFLTPSWLVHGDGFTQSSVALGVKRGLDLLVALLFLVALSPLMLLCALAIYVESGFSGPVFYRQTRVGADGLPFQVVKFRSMRVDAESDGRARWATKNDSRVTRVGRFIRKTRIDELPQILCVIKGEMSFVGPRPERPEFVADLLKKNPFYAARHRVKPGLTGWAQLCYPYGSSDEDAMRKLEYDLYYIKNQSLFLDLLILLETVEVVLLGKGAV